MNLKNPLLSVPIKFGSFAGILAITMFFVLYFMELNPFVESRLMDIILLPIFIFFSLKDFRDVRNGGVLHYWQGMTVGVLMYLLMATISALFIYIFTTWIDPNVLHEYIADRVNLMQESKVQFLEQLGEDTYEKAIVDVSATKPITLAIDDFLKKSIIGLMLTIMISIILRKQPKN